MFLYAGATFLLIGTCMWFASSQPDLMGQKGIHVNRQQLAQVETVAHLSITDLHIFRLCMFSGQNETIFCLSLQHALRTSISATHRRGAMDVSRVATIHDRKFAR